MRVSERCYAVTGLAYTAPWSLNAGFIVGREITLVVDTAATAASAATIFGYATAVLPGNLVAVINTERHFDHIGGNSYFRSREILDIYGHAAVIRTEAEFEQEKAEFADAIPNHVRRQRNEAGVFYSGTTLSLPTHPISQDMKLELGGCEVQILLTPGHTPANLSVFVPSDGVLFCGDCLVNGYLPNLECGSIPEWRQWLESIDRIEELAPLVVVPGHGPVVTGGQIPRLIQEVRAVLESAIKSGVAPTLEPEKS